MAKLQSPRGTTDLLPDIMAGHRHVCDTARSVSLGFGFEEMATPIFEFTEVFARPLGETSDVVSKETYSFTDRGGESLTLRPEGTAGAVRAMISAGLTQTLPQKYFYAGPMFRYERPQKGRMRQFHQIGVELLGVASAIGDAEVISLGHMILSRLGVAENCVLHLNTLGDTESRQAYRQALVDYLSGHKSDLSEDSQRRFDLNPLRILDSKDEGDKHILINAPDLGDYLNPVSKDHFAAVREYLDAVNIAYHINPRLVRGLDYYGHTTFEFITDALGAQGTVMAGGRYDGLAGMLGGGDIAGVGWAAGIERLAMLSDIPPSKPVDLMMIGMAEPHMATLFRLAMLLREHGLRVESAYASNLGKQMKRADRLKAGYVVILGDDEAEKKMVMVRSMTDGQQNEVAIDDLVNHMISRIQG
ncbi:MAG: histidine--tRNA ligase [Candidatus Puniceispirillales bacterium]|nr:histidine--tRNA ligase [Pseudomonadota bacterium]